MVPLPVKNKNKKHWNPASNINTDNRRMTGNVNIYICSETNENGQAKGKPRLTAPSSIDASSDASTELARSNSRCISGVSASLRKPINDVREKRQKMFNFIRNEREGSTVGGAVRDTKAWRKTRTTQTSDSNKDRRRMDVKLSDQEECKDTISSARPSKDSADSSVEPSCDNFQGASSWVAICPSEARCKFVSDDTDLSLSSATNVPNGQKDRRENDDVCGITDSGSLFKSAGTRRAADECRDVKFREKRKAPQRSIESSQTRRQRSACSCIAEEEEEDYYTNSRPTRVICREPARDVTARVRVVSLNDAGDRFEEAPISESTFRVSECSRAATVCGATLENSREPQKVARVSKKLAAEELPLLGIAVCETILRAEPKGPPEEEVVRETADSEAPEETICKIPHSNLAGQDDAERLSANDAKDKLTKERTDGTNFSGRRESVVDGEGAVLTVQSVDNVAPNLHLDEQQSAEYREDKVSHVQIRPVKDFGPNYPTNSDAKGTRRRKNFVDRGKNVGVRAAGSHLPRSVPKDPAERDFASAEGKQSKEKVAETSKERDKMGPLAKKPTKDTLLYRSLRKLLDLSRHREATRLRMRDGQKETEGNRSDSAKKKQDAEPTSIHEEVAELDDYERDRRNVGEGAHRPMRPTLANKHEIAGDTVAFVKRQRSTAIATDATKLSKGAEKRDISRMNQTTPKSKPKLLRIIAAKRSRFQPTAEYTAAEIPEPTREIGAGVDEIADEIPTSALTDRGEIPLEPAFAKIAEDTVAVESIDTSALLVQDVSRDADTPEDMAIDQKRVSEGVVDETTTDVCRSREKVEEASRELVPCEHTWTHFEPNSGLRSVTERTECKDPHEVCFRKHKRKKGTKVEECIRAPPTQYPNSRSEIDKLIFRNVSSLSRRVCTNCRGTRKECEYRRAVICFHCCRHVEEEHGCGCTHECACECRRRDKRCRGTERSRREICNKPMICLYCDNTRDECTCRAPIGKCDKRCGLPSDVCDCQDDRGHDRARERVVGDANKDGSIRVTSWKPKKEVGRYFARNDLGSGAIKDCRCHEKPKRPKTRPPYRRLNVFSDVMNELQRKMSESVCCTRCRGNTCCCCRCCYCSGGGSQVNPDEGKGRRRVEDYVRCPKVEKARSKSPDERDDGSNSKDERDGDIVETLIPIRRVARVCLPSACGCGKSTGIHKRPLAKCYYCKSLPCV